MITLFDTCSLERALSVPTDPKLRRLLTAHISHLHSADQHVRDATYFLIIDAHTTIDEIAEELGWTPLIDLDGTRYGDDAYVPFHDHLEDCGGWFVMMVTGGNEAVFVLLICDSDLVPAELISLCYRYTSGAQ
jgi:hypothetical protein